MNRTTVAIAAVSLVLAFSCRAGPTRSSDGMDRDRIRAEVLQAEADLLSALRQGDLLKGVAMHLESPGYRNIWNGEIKTHDMLVKRIKIGMEKGLKSIDYQVQGRDFNFIDADNVLETLTATETTTMKDGAATTSGMTAVSILWQRIDKSWRLGYLHASELPKAPDHPTP